MRLHIALCAALLTLPAAHARAALSVDQIMAEPDWIGAAIEAPYWAADGRAVYYTVKRKDSPIRDQHRIELSDGADHVAESTDRANLDAANAVYDLPRTRAAFIRNGDVFVREVASGRLLQITRTAQDESVPQFSADARQLQYRNGNDWYSYDFATGVNGLTAQVKTEKDPLDKKANDFEQLQLRLINTLREDHANKETLRQHAEELRKADATRVASPFFLGDDVQITDSALSPDGHWLLVVTTPKATDAGRAGKMPVYVTESGYEEVEDTRTRVGRGDLVPQTLWHIDLTTRKMSPMSSADLPGIHDDPLRGVREENEKRHLVESTITSVMPMTDRQAADARASAGKPAKSAQDQHAYRDSKGAADSAKGKENGDPKERPLQIAGIVFARDGANAAVMLRATDNKDRWIASVAAGKPEYTSQHRLTDSAWINWNFNEFGWLNDSRSLWYVSEESGFAQLYAKPLSGKARALTKGRFEVSAPVLSPDGRWFYVHANVESPYAYDVYRVAVDGGELQRVTRYQGADAFSVSPDGTQLLVSHSSSYLPLQIGLVQADGSGSPRELTDTRSAEFRAITWQAPEIVQVPSSHVKSPIYGKFYKPANSANGAKRPIVLFVHGAGYTQNTHLSYPYYFREQMFHNLLTERGYLVLDLDYRASEGYGRDWRTAIYRNMGHPELEDLIDGVDWLVKNHEGDAHRVGLYGGSYGGFMTLMAMFQAPEVFHAGAALRPVTDWSQYNHEYTANILNTPQIDDIAYRNSSPIEFAQGLKGPLLIAHGMMDDNVFFQDSVRLFQHLIELHKDNVELAPYPLERHGFTHASAWRDEYTRILKLFETHLK
ncbi:MAG: alpha/beta fold hydrolase [Tahibacter sp.]